MAAAESSATEASFEESTSDAGAAIAPSDDGGPDNIWQHASETRSTSIAHGEERPTEAGAAIAPVDEPQVNRRATPRPCRRARPTSWSRPGSSPRRDSGSAALETPRFELRSAPVDDITTAAPAAPASSVDAAHDGDAPAASAPDVVPPNRATDGGNGDAELPAADRGRAGRGADHRPKSST